MKFWSLLFGVAGGVIVGEAVWGLFEVYEVKSLYQKAKEAAEVSGKPLLVVGRPDDGMTAIAGIPDACGDICLDVQGCPSCPVSVQASVEDLSQFGDGQFGAAFVSHVIEHVGDPEKAISELHRVADNVVVCFPRAWTLGAVVNRTHCSWMGQNVDGSWWFKKIPGRECNIPRSGVVV